MGLKDISPFAPDNKNDATRVGGNIFFRIPPTPLYIAGLISISGLRIVPPTGSSKSILPSLFSRNPIKVSIGNPVRPLTRSRSSADSGVNSRPSSSTLSKPSRFPSFEIPFVRSVSWPLSNMNPANSAV